MLMCFEYELSAADSSKKETNGPSLLVTTYGAAIRCGGYGRYGGHSCASLIAVCMYVCMYGMSLKYRRKEERDTGTDISSSAVAGWLAAGDGVRRNKQIQDEHNDDSFPPGHYMGGAGTSSYLVLNHPAAAVDKR